MRTTGALLIAAIFFVFSCSKEKNKADALTGNWVLSGQCICNRCSDSVASEDAQTLSFTSDGKVAMTGRLNDSLHSYNGTYFVSGPDSGRVLNITIDGPDSVQHFLFVPGARIVLVSPTELVLNLLTPYANLCQYQNRYQFVAH